MKHPTVLFWVIVIISSLPLYAQTPIPDKGILFQDDIIPRIDILFEADSLEMLYASGNEESNHHYSARFIFNNGTVADTIEDVGFRFRGNTSRHSEKKSFKISFNTFLPGRKFHGLEKLNLNGEHNDPTVMRSKLCWDIIRATGQVGSRANHVQLYINSDYYGLYVNVEHIDEEFVKLRFGNKNGNLYKCLWPADLDYKGDDPDLYKEVPFDRRTYDLRTNREADDYTDLAHFIDILNNTPIDERACELEKVFNVDAYLKYLAIDIFTGNWDGPIYNKNNFYLYHNTATGQFEYIPYDLDNTLGIDWIGRNWAIRNIYDWAQHNHARPLYWNIMAIEEYRDRFSYYMATFQSSYFDEEYLFPQIDATKALINIPAIIDSFRVLDYGFTISDFFNSFTASLPFFHTPQGLKPYISIRNGATATQLELNNISPIITHIENNQPTSSQAINIKAHVLNDDLLMAVQLCYRVNNQPEIICVEILDNGQQNDGSSNDNIYGIILPPIENLETFHYFIEATDQQGLQSRQPRCVEKQFSVQSSIYSLYINEIMAANDAIISDEAGEYDDWIELYYNGTESLYLGDKYLSDDETTPNKWLMPDIWITPGQYLLFWADKDEEQGPMHTNFKLSASGEFIGIFDSEENNFNTIDHLNFGEQESDMALGRIPDGTGVFQNVFPTPEATNQIFTSADTPNSITLTSFKVYPNPTFDLLHIESLRDSNHLWIVQLYTAQGQLIWAENFISNKISLSLNKLSLPAGMYFLKIKDEEKMTTFHRSVLLQK